MKVTLDPETHTYRAEDGRELMGVTRALELAGLIDTHWFTQDAKWRGSVVHKIIELFNRGDLDESSVDPAVLGYLDAYKRFLKESDIHPMAEWVERPLGSEIHRFAGTLDLAAHADKASIAIVDLKSGASNKSTALQTAAYSLLMDEAAPVVPRRARFELRLTEDGKYSLKEFKDSRDYDRFLAALTIAKLRREWGLTQ